MATDEHSVALNGTAPTEASLLIALTRMETKVDVVIAQHGAQLSDHESRVRALEALDNVSFKQLWGAFAGAVAVAAAVVGILSSTHII